MRTPFRGRMLIASVAVLSLAMVACGDGGETGVGDAMATDQASFNEQPYANLRDGGTFTTPVSEMNPQFNLFHTSATSSTLEVWNWTAPRMTVSTPVGDIRPNPDYLTDARAEQVDGNTRVLLTLNPKAVFNDGTPIDWRAVEATWRANNGSNPAFTSRSVSTFRRIASVTRGADDHQAVVTYDGARPDWLRDFSSLLHPAAATPELFNTGYVNNPRLEWGTGPYRVRSYDAQQATLTLERNPSWWGAPGKLDTRTFVRMDPTAAVNAFRNGQLDAVSAASEETLAQVRTVPDADVRIGAAPAIAFYVLNSRSPVLADAAVRRSVLQGIDREQLIEVMNQGLGYAAPAPGSMLTLPSHPGYRDNAAAVLAHDPEAARRGLDAAGWVPGPDGVRARDGKRLSLQYVQLTDTASDRAMTGALTAMLKGIGVEVAARTVPTATFATVLANREFDVIRFGSLLEAPFTATAACVYYCTSGPMNYAGAGTPALDTQLAAIDRLPTRDQQLAAANEAERTALGGYGVLPMPYPPTIVATKPGLANYGASQFAAPLPETVGWQQGGA